MKKNIYLAVMILLVGLIYYAANKQSFPVVAVANYGPHSSLEDAIKGMKDELSSQGFIENKNIKYNIADVGFNSSLIPQMIASLLAQKPTLMIAMTTPVAQFAKQKIKGMPLIFNLITDPVEAGLMKSNNKADVNMSCISDMQNLDLLMEFAKALLPNAKKLGVLYSTAEINDVALIRMLKEAAIKAKLEIVAIPIDQVRDIAIRMQQFRNNVDFIYVGTSGPIQPSLPVIIAEADKMRIPVFNVNEDAVKKNQALASFGVNYIKIGKNTGIMVAKLMNGEKISKPIYPSLEDHHGFISKKKAKLLGIEIPHNLKNVTIVE